MTGLSRWKVAGWLSALVAGLVPIVLLLGGVSIVVVASESVSYRYFYNLRLLRGEPSSLFLPQGQSLGAAQHLIIWIQQAVLGIPPTQLRATLDTFGYLTLLLNWACMAAGLVAAFSSRHLTGGDKLAVGAVALVATYGSASGISMAMMPDYYGFEAAVTVIVLTVTLVQWRNEAACPLWRTGLMLGGIAGLALATKITLILTAGLPMLVVFVRSRASIRARLAGIAAFGSSAVIIALLIVGAAYRFRWSTVALSIGAWLNYLRDAGSEPNFWSSLFWPFARGAQAGANYVYVLVLVPTLGAVVLVALGRLNNARHRREALLVTLIVSAMLLHGWALFQRPAGTTLWELVLFWCAATAVILAILRTDPWATILTRVFVAAAVVVALFSASLNVPRLLPLRVLQASTVKVWDAHTFLHRHPGDKVVVIPDNRYVTGSVEEALMKGVSDFPTWNITSGQAVLNEIAPRLVFQQRLEGLSPGATVMWIDVPGEPSLTTRFPALANREREAEARCRYWDIETWAWWPRRIVVCPPAAS